MKINTVEFSELEKTGEFPLDFLAPRMGKVYVIAITRDGCPTCKRQKPKLDKLARSLEAEYGNRVAFTRIHVSFSPDSQEESLRSKALLRHYFYPTNLILVRSGDRGAVEYYRNTAPDMRELRRNIQKALEVAKFFEKKS